MLDYREHLAPGNFGLIIADVPWGYEKKMTFQQDKQRSAVDASSLAIYPKFTTQAQYDEFFALAATALTKDRMLWIWSDWWNLYHRIGNVNIKPLKLKFQGYAFIERVPWNFGYYLRKNAYFLAIFSKGKPYRNPGQQIGEFLGSYTRKSCSRSRKPEAVYQKIRDFCQPPGETWIDPFPATHVDIPMQRIAS